MSLLNITSKSLDDVIIKDSILNWIKEYTSSANIQISDNPNSDGKYVVDAEQVLLNRLVTSLTNNMFVWGKIRKNFNCSETPITSLKGAPEIVERHFNCCYNEELISLKGAPKNVGRDFICNNTLIHSIDGISDEIKGNFDCRWTDITKIQNSSNFIKGQIYI